MSDGGGSALYPRCEAQASGAFPTKFSVSVFVGLLFGEDRPDLFDNMKGEKHAKI